HAILLRETQKSLVHVILFGDAVTVELDIEIISKLAVPPYERIFSLLLTNVQNQVRNFTVQVSCRGNKVTLVLNDQVFIYPGVDAVQSFNKSIRTELRQVVVPILVFSDQYLVVTLVGIVFGELQFLALLGDKELTSYDRFDFVVQGLAYELKGAVHVPQVRQSYRRHVQSLCFCNERFDVRCSLQDREL